MTIQYIHLVQIFSMIISISSLAKDGLLIDIYACVACTTYHERR